MAAATPAKAAPEQCFHIEQAELGSHITIPRCVTAEQLRWERDEAERRARQAITYVNRPM